MSDNDYVKQLVKEKEEYVSPPAKETSNDYVAPPKKQVMTMPRLLKKNLFQNRMSRLIFRL